MRRSPHGLRGLKLKALAVVLATLQSQPAWAAGIEIIDQPTKTVEIESQPAWAAGIEIQVSDQANSAGGVAARMGCGD